MSPLFDYTKHDAALTRLLSLVDDILTHDDQLMVQQFIDADEYGLAFDCIAGYLLERNALLSHDLVKDIYRVADIVQADADDDLCWKKFVRRWPRPNNVVNDDKQS